MAIFSIDRTLVLLFISSPILSINELQIRALCQVHCKNSYNEKSNDCGNQCKDCQLACQKPTPLFEDCPIYCKRFQNEKKCAEGCAILQHLRMQSAYNSSISSSPIKSLKLICSNFDRNPNSGILAKFFIERGEKFELSAYILHIRQKMWSLQGDRFTVGKWYSLGIRLDQTFIIYKLSPNAEYQIKVETIQFPYFVFDQLTSNNTLWFRSPTVNLSYFRRTVDVALNPPLYAKKQREFLSNNKLQARITWVPQTNYDTDYVILLRSVSSLEHSRIESSAISLKFRTSTCLDMNERNFTVCEPGSVSGFTVKVLSEDFSVLVHWSPPKYVNTSEQQLNGYSFRWRSLAESQRCQDHGKQEYFILPNVTEFTLSRLSKECTYITEVRAISIGDHESTWSSITFNHSSLTGYTGFESGTCVCEDFNHLAVNSTISTFLVVACVVTAALVFIALVVVFVNFGRNKSELSSSKMQHSSRSTSLASFLITHRLKRNTNYEQQNNSVSFENDSISEIWTKSIRLDRLIGNGEFGCVWQASCLVDGYPPIVAVKKIKDYGDRREARKHLENEISLMKFIGVHENIVSFFGSVHKPDLALIMEFCSLGNLKTYLQCIKDQLIVYRKLEISPGADSGYGKVSNYGFGETSKIVPICNDYELVGRKKGRDGQDNQGDDGLRDSALLLKFARQIASGMEHISDLGLVHCDLAARNILVTEKSSGEKVLKISDFGMCRVCRSDNPYKSSSNSGANSSDRQNHKLPVRWMAPESFPAAGHRVNSRSDVWSYGVVLWEMATLGAQQPYDQFEIFDVEQAYRKIAHEGYRLPKPGNCSIQLYGIMEACWQLKPHVRPTFSVIRRELEDFLEKNEYVSIELNELLLYAWKSISSALQHNQVPISNSGATRISSHFYPSPIKFDGKLYNNAGQLCQAKKAEFFNDQSFLTSIMETKHPVSIKKIG
uniref:receptor protein-tyrosine kinase n=1 Tax=Romanomermis culicivorax TaxID=13658 RepID=A0A915L244_ROMCU